MIGSQAKPTTDVSRFRDALTRIYSELDAAIALKSPVCRLSGRCCRFKEYDHTLFISAPEAAFLIAEAPPPVRPLDDGETCPWQDLKGHCTARDARPLGCRVYYCDPAYQDSAVELSETYLGSLRGLVDGLSLAWNYAPLHQHLRAAELEQRIEFPQPKPGAALIAD